jgi:hypothetical protein
VAFLFDKRLWEIILNNIFIRVFHCLVHAVAGVERFAFDASAAYVPVVAYVSVDAPVSPFVP